MDETFERFLEDPIPNLADYEEKDYKLDGAGFMYKHLDTIEMETMKFLQSITSARDNGFKKAFLQNSQTW